MMTTKLEKLKTFVKDHYKNDQGDPFILTDSQAEIFEIISTRKYPRTRVITPTQMGKSTTTAMALVTRCSSFPEKWAIVAPTASKAQIIMRYAMEHALENPYAKAKLMNSEDDKSIAHLGRERSKTRLTFRIEGTTKIGELIVLSAGGHRTSDVESALSGFGASNICLDESSLIDDKQHAMVVRMLGGHADNFLLEIGNPYRRNHFYRIGSDPNYHKVFIDWKKAVQEGRYTLDFIAEMRKKPLFDVLYECKFPDEMEADEEGWTPLLTFDQVQYARTTSASVFGRARLGVDLADGSEAENVWVLRYENLAKVIRRDHNRNQMGVVGQTIEIMKQYDVAPGDVTIDGIGIGAGIVDRMWENKYGVQNFIAGEKAQNPDRYWNKRAEGYWRLREWIMKGGMLEDSDVWDELADIKWRVKSDEKIIIRSKDDMMKYDGLGTLDVSSALMMTFSAPTIERPTVHLSLEAQEFMAMKQKERGLRARSQYDIL